jgi:hypothetical protein
MYSQAGCGAHQITVASPEDFGDEAPLQLSLVHHSINTATKSKALLETACFVSIPSSQQACALEFLHFPGDLERHHLEFRDLGEARRAGSA